MRVRLLAGTSLLVLCASVAAASAAPIIFSYTGGLQTFTAPTAGTYDILAFGAQGGTSFDTIFFSLIPTAPISDSGDSHFVPAVIR